MPQYSGQIDQMNQTKQKRNPKKKPSLVKSLWPTMLKLPGVLPCYILEWCTKTSMKSLPLNVCMGGPMNFGLIPYLMLDLTECSQKSHPVLKRTLFPRNF